MKTIINIVSAQTLPNYLFVKQMYEQGDKIVWIVSSNKKVQQAMSSLSSNLSDITNQQEISLTEGSEENVDCITNLLKKEIPLNDNYYVNLTGGTKLMAIAVYDFVKNNCKNVSFFYIPLPKNIIKNIITQEEREITYRISISEYLSLYNIPISGGHKPYLSFEKAKDMFGKMSNIIERYPNELAELRELKDRGVFRRHKDQQILSQKVCKFHSFIFFVIFIFFAKIILLGIYTLLGIVSIKEYTHLFYQSLYTGNLFLPWSKVSLSIL